jgi:hypothetical protein
VGNSRGARKLARTPHVNQKKKKKKEKKNCNGQYQMPTFVKSLIQRSV